MMFQWLVLAAIVAVGLSEPAANPAAAADPKRHRAYAHDDHDDGHDDKHDQRHDSHRNAHGGDHDQWRDHHRDAHDGDHYHRRDNNRDAHDGHHDHRRDHNRDAHDSDPDHRRDHQRDAHDGDHIGPNVVRVLDPQQVAFDPHNCHQKRIIQNVNSPDYYQPTWILDYRYLKTGGRDYTRSDGGQILILPKGIQSHEPKEYTFINYDELLEFLRLKRLAEAEKYRIHIHKTHDHEAHVRKEHRGYEQKRSGHRSY